MNIPTTVASTVTHTPPAGLKKFSQTLESIEGKKLTPLLTSVLGIPAAAAPTLQDIVKHGDTFRRLPIQGGTYEGWKGDWENTTFPIKN
jgi:hypothetical protein